MHVYEVIKRPIITEKTQYMYTDLGQATFEVDRRANKAQIKEAVETVFEEHGVRVSAVQTMVMPAKSSRRWGRRRVVRQPTWKKAVVTLSEGRIPWFEGG